MSVQQRRFAAATRTAAPKRGSRSRLKLTLTWLIVLSALSLFTTTVVATAAGGKPDYAGAAEKLASNQPMIVIQTGKKRVCSVNAAQLAKLQAEYDTGWMTVTLNGVQTDLVTVSGANAHDVGAMVGTANCKLVQEKHVFYLPFDANIS
jgi:hypothetical protein